jgi:antitoxin component of MazEF toxin-antitoxin module
MMMSMVKLRKVGGSLVMTIPTCILADSAIRDGDRVLIQTDGMARLIVTLRVPASEVEEYAGSGGSE